MTGSLLLTFREHREPAARLAKAAGLPLAEVDVHRFPDGEVRVRLPEPLAAAATGQRSAPAPARVLLMRSLDDPNGKLIELLLAAETARTLGTSEVVLVAPYLGYMRQDIAFRPGEAVSQRVIGRFLGQHFDRVITVDPHLHRTRELQDVVPGATCTVLSATGPLADFLIGRFGAPLLVGPDAESEQWVAAIAARAGVDWVVGAKERTGDAEVRVRLPEAGFAGRDVVLVDDVVSTGRSLVSAASAIRRQGPRSVSALVTHGLFVDGALDELTRSGIENVWASDSVPGARARVELAALLAAAL